VALIVVAAVVVIVGAYVVYVVATYSRIADHEKLAVNTDVYSGAASYELLKTGEEYTAFTYNIGFGAYDHDYSFFMDTGAMADGTETAGKSSRAASKDAAAHNTELVTSAVLSEMPDIALFQEVDVKADRSYDVDQRGVILDAMDTYYGREGGVNWTFASNFHSAYLFYPPTKPIGKISESGLLTVSHYTIGTSMRWSYPVSDAFPTKFFDLDRCFTVNRMPVTDDAGAPAGDLVLINTHMSAYDKGGTIRREQMKLLGEVIANEYELGNWVIVGGDFNHAIGGSENKFMNGMQRPPWVEAFAEDQLPEHFRMVIADNADTVATDRDTSIPYTKGVNYEVTLDGFIVSDNVKASSENIDTDYEASDHNPVKLKFSLQ
jgi:endonuclease/exonuclease/phosphatase family metal-dependent hydrolase